MRFPLVLLTLFLFHGTGIAQYRYGIKGGLNISDVVMTNYVNPDAESDLDLKLGIHGGIFASSELDDRWTLAGELLYSGKGVRAISNINLSYINTVVMLQYLVSDKFLIEGGGELGYLFAAKSEGVDVSNIWNNKLDLGLDAGVQYRLSDTVAAGLRYNAGFSSVIDVRDDGSGNTPGETVKYQNRVVQLSLYYSLGW